MRKVDTTGTRPTEVQLIERYLRLDGEDLYLVRSGKRVSPRTVHRSGYYHIYFEVPNGKGGSGTRTVKLHRAKFYLANGWMPPSVDHKDRDTTNNELVNLRAADNSLQMHNRTRKPRTLPRGVMKVRSKYRAKVRFQKRYRHLGMFDTPEEASLAVEAFLKEAYGPDYSPT